MMSESLSSQWKKAAAGIVLAGMAGMAPSPAPAADSVSSGYSKAVLPVFHEKAMQDWNRGESPDYATRLYNDPYQRPIDDGFKYLVEGAFPASRVLLFLDLNHETSSRTLERDLFSPANLEIISRAGVKDVYLEIPRNFQPVADQLAAGKISRGRFMDETTRASRIAGLDQDELRQTMGHLADVIQTAAALPSPIRIYCAQISETKEAKNILDAYAGQRAALAADANDILAEWKKSSGAAFTAGGEKSFDEIRQFFDSPERHKKPDYEAIFLSQPGGHNQDFARNCAARLEDLSDTLQSTAIAESSTMVQFRHESDGALADLVANSGSPGSPKLVVHGAAHGGRNKTDLDDILKGMGLPVTKVNLVYNKADLLSAMPQHRDLSEINFNPRANQVRFVDFNADGVVQGSPHAPDTGWSYSFGGLSR